MAQTTAQLASQGAKFNSQGDIQYPTSGGFDLQYTPDGGAYSAGTGNYTPAAGLSNEQKSMIGGTQPNATPPANPLNPVATTPPTPSTPATPPIGQITTGAPGANQAVPFDQAIKNIPQGAGSAQIQANLEKAYGMAHQQLQQGGTQPNGKGGNMSAVKSAVAQNTSQPETPSLPQVDNAYATNPFLKQTNDQLMEFLNPKNTSDSLQTFVDAYAQDRAELAGLKTELMNNKRIMGGTETDIRDEVTKVGGFATESQVQAMTLGRNKALIARNAQLADLVSSAQDAIQTDMQMYGMAKDQANTQFNQRMSILNYQQENTKFMYNAAQDQIKNNITYMGGVDTYYNSLKDNPQQLSYTESLLGMAPGGLAIAATQKAKERVQEQRKADLQNQVLESNLLTDKYQRANIQSQINDRNASSAGTSQGVVPGERPKGKPDPQAAAYATRAIAASSAINSNIQTATKLWSVVGNDSIPNFLKSAETQQVEQAQRNFINAVLRKESGASILPSEFDSAKKQYFPQRGDTDDVLIQKAQNRVDSINGLIGSGGTAYNGTYIKPTYTKELSATTPDGKTYTFPDQEALDKFKKAANIQ